MVAMNFVKPDSIYSPDYLFIDRYERDVITGIVGVPEGFVEGGYLMNSPDLKVYIAYIQAISRILWDIPMALWQMVGSSMQVAGAMFTPALCDTIADFVFGHPGLNKDMANMSPLLVGLQKNFGDHADDWTVNYGISDPGIIQNYLRMKS